MVKSGLLVPPPLEPEELQGLPILRPHKRAVWAVFRLLFLVQGEHILSQSVEYILDQ